MNSSERRTDKHVRVTSALSHVAVLICNLHQQGHDAVNHWVDVESSRPSDCLSSQK
jgi:hypothetical protein